MGIDKPLRLVFAGTPEFAAVHLQALVDSEHEVCAVYTQPDRRAGRSKKLLASPVKQRAQSAGIDVRQPPSLKEPERQKELAALSPDLLVVVAYGLILPQEVLDIPRLSCINVHASLLPRWRGAAPIQRAIEAGDSRSGITIMEMDAGLDTGPMLATRQLDIAPGTTSGELHDQLLGLGPALLLDVLDNFDRLNAGATPQPAGASYAHKIEKVAAKLDWQQSAAKLHRKILAFNPVPVAWTTLDGDPVRIWAADICEHAGPAGEILQCDANGMVVACGTGALALQRLQLAGGKPLDVRGLLNARRDQFAAGTVLGH